MHSWISHRFSSVHDFVIGLPVFLRAKALFLFIETPREFSDFNNTASTHILEDTPPLVAEGAKTGGGVREGG